MTKNPSKAISSFVAFNVIESVKEISILYQHMNPNNSKVLMLEVNISRNKRLFHLKTHNLKLKNGNKSIVYLILTCDDKKSIQSHKFICCFQCSQVWKWSKYIVTTNEPKQQMNPIKVSSRYSIEFEEIWTDLILSIKNSLVVSFELGLYNIEMDRYESVQLDAGGKVFLWKQRISRKLKQNSIHKPSKH